ncbi:TfoX/Sxy family DNA transformation protein [Roseovarius arcticus]|uniref:TfoX/Sxy family DNA transformation protein n=1 Tax=Roseovarius arcticus TaxID=2547404 RepID=UPI0011100F0F|nr:TfoX/Sxy family DNA transformation protein [Roseovarius arcticus]
MTDTRDPVSSIRNLGPAVEAACARAGIHSAEALRDIGPDAGYARLIASGTAPHFIGYYAMVMGLQGRPWNDCQGAEKSALRARFDYIKKTAQVAHKDEKGRTPMDAALAEIGVVERSQPTSSRPAKK